MAVDKAIEHVEWIVAHEDEAISALSDEIMSFATEVNEKGSIVVEEDFCLMHESREKPKPWPMDFSDDIS